MSQNEALRYIGLSIGIPLGIIACIFCCKFCITIYKVHIESNRPIIVTITNNPILPGISNEKPQQDCFDEDPI